MASIQPFAALRPVRELAQRICELPYDVMSTEEARQTAAQNPLSFLHVSKPEIDLPVGTDPYAEEVYLKGKQNFRKLLEQGSLQPDPAPCFYLYRQIMGSHCQTGLVATASCQDYLAQAVKKHELTRPDKEDDRVRHIRTLQSQTGPVFLVYRATKTMDDFVGQKISEEPATDFVAQDGVRHSAWVIDDPSAQQFLQAEFAEMASLYIADGHHRCAAAARVYQNRRSATSVKPDPSAWFLSVIFPHNQVQILPYNRVLKDLNGLSAKQLLEKLDGVFVVEPGGNSPPGRRHELGLYLGNRWYRLHFRPRFAATNDPIEKLDVTLLQKYVLEPIFGIENPRTSKRINFVGGIRGMAELEALVSCGEYGCAFALFPTRIEDLMTVAETGGVMPPKSTWFEPKLRDGMFCYLL